MITEWQKLPLIECLDALIDYRGKTPTKTTSGIPLVTAKIIKNGRIEKHTEFISFSDYEPWMRRGIPKEGDVVMTTEAPLGEVAQIGKDKIALAQRVITLRSKAELLDSTYLLYLLQTKEMQDQLKNRSTGTTVLGIKQSELRKIIVTLPPMKLQKNARMLAILDKRIDLLRETNTTLESIAQALFKSWFIDFDPVHAKAEGREPEGMDAETAALFPDGFEESELGLIPKKWGIASLGEITSYLSRGISPKYIENGGVIVINQKCIRANIVDLTKARRHDLTQRKITGRELLIGDVLVNSTGVGTLGRVAQVLYIDEPVIVDSHVTVVRAAVPLTWNYLGLNLLERQVEIEQLGEGSTGQTELSRSMLAKLEIIIPSATVLVKFDSLIMPIREQFSNNLKKIKSLTSLRDVLLPRLISGELCLNDEA